MLLLEVFSLARNGVCSGAKTQTSGTTHETQKSPRRSIVDTITCDYEGTTDMHHAYEVCHRTIAEQRNY